MASGGGDEAVKQSRGLDLIAPAECLNDAVDVTTTLAAVLDVVEVLVAADLLDTYEHGCRPDCGQATMPNLIKSRFFRELATN